jgi:biopolymer transport protein ExbB/TolQ
LPSPVRDKEWILASLLELVPKEAVARESDRVMLLETFSRELDGKDRTGPLEKLRTSSTVFMFRRYINGGIQFLTVWAFFSGMFLVLAVHVPQAAREHAVITKITRRLAMDGGAPKLVEDAGENGLLAADAPEGALSPSGARDLRDALRKLNEQDASAVVETLAAASHTFAVTTAVQEASRTLERSTGGLRDGLDSRHAYLRYIAWAIPSLGFIGTIVGIGNALDNAHRVVTTSGGETYQQEGAIQAITAQLGVAFDTTLVALLASLVLMLCIYLVGRYEDRWVERLSTAGDRLLTWFDGSRLEELLSQAIGEKIKSQNLELNKAVITEALREHQAELGQIAVGRKKP